MLKELTEARDTAQNALAEAEIALIEANASADVLRVDAQRLNAAVAALNGDFASQNTPIDPVLPALSSEEFDTARKKRQAAKEKEEQANNPLAHIKCTGCGVRGNLQEQIMTGGAGNPIRMMVCSCGNQIMS
jgi:outer membrane murein-binding lipoprotein Lpp